MCHIQARRNFCLVTGSIQEKVLSRLQKSRKTEKNEWRIGLFQRIPGCGRVKFCHDPKVGIAGYIKNDSIIKGLFDFLIKSNSPMNEFPVISWSTPSTFLDYGVNRSVSLGPYLLFKVWKKIVRYGSLPFIWNHLLCSIYINERFDKYVNLYKLIKEISLGYEFSMPLDCTSFLDFEEIVFFLLLSLSYHYLLFLSIYFYCKYNIQNISLLSDNLIKNPCMPYSSYSPTNSSRHRPCSIINVAASTPT